MTEKAQDLSEISKKAVFAGEGCFSDAVTCLPNTDETLVVTSRGMLHRDFFKPVNEHLSSALVRTVSPNPALAELTRLVTELKTKNIRHILAIGGGSVLDAGKVLSVLLQNKDSDPAALIKAGGASSEVIPVTAVPTTSGTGAEVTPFATVWDKENKKKLSMTGLGNTVQSVYLDPCATVSASRDLTRDCALDTCSHAMETLWNRHSTDDSRRFAKDSLEVLVSTLPKLQSDLASLTLRQDMQRASFLAGAAITVNRTALAHSMSYPLTLHFGVPHGLACSFTLEAIAGELDEKISGWVPVDCGDVVSRVRQLLNKEDLPERIRKYCSPEDALALSGEMFTPGRSDNFLLASPDLTKIILSAFASR
jgi:alcohol dehydrogenase